jgi:hypothetical protein
MKITFHGLCGISLQGSPARVFFPFHHHAPHKAVLMAEARHLFKKKDVATSDNVPDTTWNPDGIGLTEKGRQFCFWILTSAVAGTPGARMTLNPAGAVAPPTPEPSRWERRGNVLDLVTPLALSEIGPTDERLGQGALLTLPAGKASIAGKVEGPKLKLLNPVGREVQTGGFPNSIQWTAYDDESSWFLENGESGLYIHFNKNAWLTITNASPDFSEADTNHHLAGIYEGLERLGSPVPDAEQVHLEGPMIRSAEEGVNCIPPTDMP